MDLLHVAHLSKHSRGSGILDDINFHYSFFKRLAIAGETGSGKTTLLKAIGGLVQPDSGEILFKGQRVAGPHEKLLPGHPGIAYLSQHFELRNNYVVGDFLEMASKLEKQEAMRIYELCQIAHLLKRRTDQLSGGERQRTALARLLTTAPDLLLLDEPYSNLDGIHRQVLKVVLDDIVKEGKTSCLMVSHDPEDVLPWAEEVLVMQEGIIRQRGTPRQVYSLPADEYTGGLFGDYNLLSASEVYALFGWQAPGSEKRLFIRPERLQLTSGHAGAVKGTVVSVLFFGSFYEVNVRVNGVALKVKTNQGSLQPGDEVTVTLTQEDLCYL